MKKRKQINADEARRVGTINDAITIPTLLGSVVLLAIYKALARR